MWVFGAHCPAGRAARGSSTIGPKNLWDTNQPPWLYTSWRLLILLSLKCYSKNIRLNKWFHIFKIAKSIFSKNEFQVLPPSWNTVYFVLFELVRPFLKVRWSHDIRHHMESNQPKWNYHIIISLVFYQLTTCLYSNPSHHCPSYRRFGSLILYHDLPMHWLPLFAPFPLSFYYLFPACQYFAIPTPSITMAYCSLYSRYPRPIHFKYFWTAYTGDLLIEFQLHSF